MPSKYSFKKLSLTLFPNDVLNLNAMDKEQTKKDFHTIINNYPEEVQTLAIDLRALIFDIYPETVEVPWVQQKVVGYGVGPKKMREHFCYMVFAKKHINFGFNRGAILEDPNGLLGGTGKKFRNTKIRTSEDIDRPALATLIRTAIEERELALKQ